MNTKKKEKTLLSAGMLIAALSCLGSACEPQEDWLEEDSEQDLDQGIDSDMMTSNAQEINNNSAQGPGNPPPPSTDATFSYYLNGTALVSKFVITDTTSLVQIDRTTIYVFGNDNDLLAWANTEANTDLQLIKNNINKKTSELRSLQQAAIDNGFLNNEAAYLEWIEMNLEPTDASATGFTSTNYRGSSILCAWPIPKLPTSFDNNIESVFGALTVFFDGAFFTRSKFWLYAGPYGVSNLGAFNNKATSVF